jgi:plasmid stability protein
MFLVKCYTDNSMRLRSYIRNVNTNVQLRIELAATHTKVVEVEHREQTLPSDNDGLHKDFDDLQTSHAAVVQEKADLEKMECEKAQRF